MGTRGHRVWRYRNIYRVQYNGHDSYPSGLGLEMLREIPKGKRFIKWVEKRQRWFDSDHKNWLRDTGGVRDYRDYEEPWFQTARPKRTEDWLYEIDLDHLVFLVDSHPLFRLDCMPDEEIFVKSIDVDSHSIRHYAITTPEKHRYESILAERALPVARKFLRRYKALRPKVSSASDVLQFPVTDTPHTRLIELIASDFAIKRHEIFQWRAASCQEDIKEISIFAYCLFTLSIWPKLSSGIRRDRLLAGEIDPPLDGLDSGYWWPTPGLCVRLVPQLQDKDTMKAAIVDVVEAIALKDTDSTVFGVLFNVLHICILRVSYKDDEQVVEHTPALPFLQSFIATTPQTEGISALAALSQVVYKDLLFATVKPSPDKLPPLLAKLPVELFESIGKHLGEKSLFTFASLSVETFEGCFPLLNFVYIGRARLLATRRAEEEPTRIQELEQRKVNQPLTCLQTARFSTDREYLSLGHPLQLRVRPWEHKSPCTVYLSCRGNGEGQVTVSTHRPAVHYGWRDSH